MTCLPASLAGICYVGRNTDDEMMSGEPSRVCVGGSRFWTHGHRYCTPTEYANLAGGGWAADGRAG